MKLYTNLAPVLKGNMMPCLQPNGVIKGEDELKFIEEGSVFKLAFIDCMNVYLKHEGKVYIFNPVVLGLLFKETEMGL